MCHAVGGTGAELGPALDGWGRGKSADVIATAIVHPNAEIALGYEGTELKTKDGLTIQGVLIKQGDPLMMRSMGGITQIIPADRVADASAHEGIADDERRAAGPHRAGCRGSRRVPAQQLIAAPDSPRSECSHCDRTCVVRSTWTKRFARPAGGDSAVTPCDQTWG